MFSLRTHALIFFAIFATIIVIAAAGNIAEAYGAPRPPRVRDRTAWSRSRTGRPSACWPSRGPTTDRGDERVDVVAVERVEPARRRVGQLVGAVHQ